MTHKYFFLFIWPWVQKFVCRCTRPTGLNTAVTLHLVLGDFSLHRIRNTVFPDDASMHVVNTSTPRYSFVLWCLTKQGDIFSCICTKYIHGPEWSIRTFATTVPNLSFHSTTMGVFRRCGKIAGSDLWLRHVCLSVRPSALMEQLASGWTDFH